MKASDYRAKNETELNDELKALLREQFNLRMQKGVGQLGKQHQIKQTRRDIARIKTILNEKVSNES